MSESTFSGSQQSRGHHNRTRSWIGRGDLRNGQSKAHSTNASDEPTPDGGGSASGIKRVGVRGHHGTVETRDTQSEAEGRPESEFSLKHLLRVSTWFLGSENGLFSSEPHVG